MKNLTIGRILSLAAFAVLPTIFAIEGVSSTLEGHGPGGLVFVLLAVVLMVWVWRAQDKAYTKRRQMKERNFDWYRSTYSSHFRNGRVTCHKCGCDRVNARALLRHTYMREHFCTQCGETLYYSPEATSTA